MDSEDVHEIQDTSTHKEEKRLSRIWNILGQKLPQDEVVFFCHMLIIIIIVSASIYNLSVGEEKTSVWLSLLTSSCSYLIPPPKLKQSQNNGDR